MVEQHSALGGGGTVPKANRAQGSTSCGTSGHVIELTGFELMIMMMLKKSRTLGASRRFDVLPPNFSLFSAIRVEEGHCYALHEGKKMLRKLELDHKLPME